jgi:hypothetical protein
MGVEGSGTIALFLNLLSYSHFSLIPPSSLAYDRIQICLDSLTGKTLNSYLGVDSSSLSPDFR